jgi:hypothetical protein
MKIFRIEIKNDLFHIARRLKKIDRNYKVFFNQNSLNFEVWHRRELSFVVGKSLDNFALLKAHKTNVRNAKKLFCDIQETNEKLQEREQAEVESKAKNSLSSVLNYAENTSREVDWDNSFSTKWF